MSLPKSLSFPQLKNSAVSSVSSQYEITPDNSGTTYASGSMNFGACVTNSMTSSTNGINTLANWGSFLSLVRGASKILCIDAHLYMDGLMPYMLNFMAQYRAKINADGIKAGGTMAMLTYTASRLKAYMEKMLHTAAVSRHVGMMLQTAAGSRQV